MTTLAASTLVPWAALFIAITALSCSSAEEPPGGQTGGTHPGGGGNGAAGGTTSGGGTTGTGGGGGAGGSGGAPWAIPAGCIDHAPPMMFDTSDDCTSIETIDRVFDIESLRWKGSDYLVVNEGNEFKIWNVDQPNEPQITLWHTYFNVPNVGDSDYDLFDIALCADCRYGAVTYKANIVELFDLGTGATPSLQEHERYGQVFGGGNVAFMHDGQQYLLDIDLKDECGGDLAALHRLNGILPGDLELVECLGKPSGVMDSHINGGQLVPGPTADYLYVTGQFNKLYIFRIDDQGSSISLTHVGPSTPLWGSIGRSDSFAIDLHVQPPLALRTVGNSTIDALTLYDLSDPANPTELSNLELATNSAALWYPFAWASSAAGDTYTFDVTDPTAPVPLDQDVWSPTQPWNNHDCTRSYDALFHPQGSMLYVARYSVMQKFNLCGPPGGW